MLPKFVIMFNGPPRAGKDTASALLSEYLEGSRILKFTEVVKNIAHENYGLSVSHDYFEEQKDEPIEIFSGKTPRQLYIETSEKIRSEEGPHAVAKKFIERLEAMSTDIVINPDVGFDFEAEHVADAVGIDNILLFHVHRDGKNFDNDCRNWVHIAGVEPIQIHNDNLTLFKLHIITTVADFLESRGYKTKHLGI